VSTVTQPSNISFLSPLGFKFNVKKAPHLNFFVQSVNLPNVSLGEVDVDTPFSKIPFPGTRLLFGNLSITFKVDEDMKNYLEMFNWMKELGFPDNFDQFNTISKRAIYTGEGIFSDTTLIILTSAMNPNIEVTFIDCFPVDLSELSFDSTSGDVEYVTATVTFANRRFDIKAIP